VLELAGLRAAYGPIEALRGVDLEVRAGELVCLLGANGAGKSSTLRTISGLVRPTAGRIVFDGRPIAGLPPAAILAAGIAHCPEGRRVFPYMSVEENLAMGAYVRRDQRGVAEDLERVCTHFPILGERRRQAAGTLSGGEQQMLAIGRALMTNPKLLILDEATEGLAPLIRDEIWNCLSMLKARGQSILVIDKNVEHLTRICDRHTIIERGRTVWSGTSEQLMAEPDLQHRYLGI